MAPCFLGSTPSRKGSGCLSVSGLADAPGQSSPFGRTKHVGLSKLRFYSLKASADSATPGTPLPGLTTGRTARVSISGTNTPVKARRRRG